MIIEAIAAPVANPEDSASLSDYLTKIGNRRYFEQKLKEALEKRDGAPGAATILLLDLDRFKAVNDSLGHAVGDMLLCLVVRRISSVLSEEDTFARLGGDEFGILLGSDVKPDYLAAQLVELVQRTYLIEGCPVNIGLSIGLASSPEDAEETASLMRCADLALYEIKAGGRNGFANYNPAMAQRAKDKRELELALRKAVALRQLELSYRPQLDVQTKLLAGVEAVLQWRHPKRGLIDAPVFIPLAEEIGVIKAISEWSLRAVCREAARWPENVPCSVSVSSLSFESDAFFETVRQALQAAGIEGPKLELEVTEGILLRDGQAVLRMLDRLRSIGVRVAVDSFGTGIASLCQMVNFPLDKIKIARSLVEQEGTGRKERAIVRAIAALGDSLGISTVVEGVDTSEHLERIQQDGCSTVQGYLLGKAVPGEMLGRLIGTLLDSNQALYQEI